MLLFLARLGKTINSGYNTRTSPESFARYAISTLLQRQITTRSDNNLWKLV